MKPENPYSASHPGRELAIEQIGGCKRLEIVVQNQSFWNIVGARPTAAPRNRGRDDAAGIIIVWRTSPPHILQIHSLDQVATQWHSFSCSSWALWNIFHHFAWVWDQLYGPFRLGLSTEVRWCPNFTYDLENIQFFRRLGKYYSTFWRSDTKTECPGIWTYLRRNVDIFNI